MADTQEHPALGADWRWTRKERMSGVGGIFGLFAETVFILEDRWGTELAVLQQDKNDVWCWHAGKCGSATLRIIQQHTETELLAKAQTPVVSDVGVSTGKV